MCKVKAPKPQVIEAAKPTFVRNPFLDELDGDVASVDALRRGRSSLVIPTGTGIGFEGRGSGAGGGATGVPKGNSRGPAGGRGGRGGSGGGDSGPYVAGTAPPKPPRRTSGRR